MYDEREFQNYNTGNDVVTECRVTETGGNGKKPGRKKKAAKLIAGVMCAALIACGGYAVGSASTGKNDALVQEAAGQENTGSSSDKQAANAEAMSATSLISGNSSDRTYTVAEIAARYMSSVVAITAKSTEEVYSMFGGVQEYESEGAGSGIIVAKTDTELIIATNNHVVEGADDLTVCFNDSEEQVYEAYIKGTDSSNDLAVVAVKLSDVPEEVLNTLTVAVLGDSDDCVIGEQVVAIGNALGYGQSLTSGYVSALNRVITVDGVTYTLIQTDAAINPGNSGGALFNMRGEVIGINSVKFASSEVEGMGYAIPISKAIPILNELAARETREEVAEEDQGYLGITPTDVTSAIASYYNMPVGIYVSAVEEDSAAEAAGVKAGDIITSFDGMSVSGITQLKNYLQYYKAGETVELVVKRLTNGVYEEKTLNITLGEKPVSAAGDTDAGTDGQNYQNGRGNGYGNGYGSGYGYFPNR